MEETWRQRRSAGDVVAVKLMVEAELMVEEMLVIELMQMVEVMVEA